MSATVVDGPTNGLPEAGQQLLLFGSGCYRSSSVYLAYKPMVELGAQGGFRFYAGSDAAATPRWTEDEEGAVPLFCEGCVGELSVRWNPLLGAWICLYLADPPVDGIVCRWAQRAYGPWSDARIVFTTDDGRGDFIHVPGGDETHDRESDGATRDRSGEFGGVYGTYQITRYARPAGNGVRVFFTMSVWNPYQVMLMTFTIPMELW